GNAARSELVQPRVASLAVLLERKLTIVLPEEVEEALVVTRLHVEQARHDFVIAASFFESFAHDLAHVPSGDFPIDEQWIDRRPERFALFDHSPIEIFRHGTSSLALPAQRHVLVNPDL